MTTAKEKIQQLRLRLQRLDDALTSSSDDDENSSTSEIKMVQTVLNSDEEDKLLSASSSTAYNCPRSSEKKQNKSDTSTDGSDCDATDTTSIMAFHRQKYAANRTNRFNQANLQTTFVKTLSVDSGKGSSINRTSMSASMDEVHSMSLSSDPKQVHQSSGPNQLYQQITHPPLPAPMFQKLESFEICGKCYRILSLLGKGGSSSVYLVYDEESKNCFAVKCVDLSDADEIVKKAYANEILLLEKLQHSNRVVKMYAYEFAPEKNLLYVVMEKGDTDLATLFKTKKEERLSEVTIAYFWAEMLKAVQVVHQQGIVHSDLKPANFLLVAGHLKLIDFGIANAVPANKTSITKESHMGTLNYMSPEAMSNAGGPYEYKFKVGVKSDVWSLGCILYNMVYGKTPFQHIGHPAGKLMAITNPKYLIEYPPISDPSLLDVMKKCLQRDPKHRPSIEQLLNHNYVINKPACTSSADNAGINEDLLELAKVVGKNTPKTGAKILKKALSQLQLKKCDLNIS